GLAKARVEKRLAELESGPAGASGSGAKQAKLIANGFYSPQTFNCAATTYSFPLGPRFDFAKSFVVAFEFTVPEPESYSQYLFRCGDDQLSRSPIQFRFIPGSKVDFKLADANTGSGQSWVSNAISDPVGKWVSI